MELTYLLNSLNSAQVIGEVQRKDVANITYDSRKVKKGSVFVAIRGFNTDGHRFILEAINNGALAVILEDSSTVPDEIFIHRGVAKILVSNSRKALAEISGSFYKKPSEKMKVIGITGTNGKTTTSYLLKAIFEASGEKTGLIGTIKNLIGDTEIKSNLTTPESNDLNELLYQMYSSGCTTAVMEVSSHSLALDRVYKINFHSAVFTNLTSDHLDFHKTFENYRDSKKLLFDYLNRGAFCISNADDKNAAYLVKDSAAQKYYYGTSGNPEFRLSDIVFDLGGTNFIIEFEGRSYPVSTSLVGGFNAYNAAAAFAASVLAGIDTSVILDAIKNIRQIPGRFEVLSAKNKKVIVDYSHTADSLEKTLRVIREISGNERKVYTVFGCGGNRDAGKRPEMGRIASELSDLVYVTSDNPRNEDPFVIINAITKGIVRSNYAVIENREDAIKTAIKNSEDNAVILIAGKGHENYQEINGVRSYFSDKETAEKYLSL